MTALRFLCSHSLVFDQRLDLDHPGLFSRDAQKVWNSHEILCHLPVDHSSCQS